MRHAQWARIRQAPTLSRLDGRGYSAIFTYLLCGVARGLSTRTFSIPHVLPASQAKQAISDYKKAVGDPEGVAELMVFYYEQAAGFCSDICSDDEGYFNALVRMFEQALQSGRHSASVSLGSVLGAPDPIRQPAAVPPPLLRCPVAGVS